MNRNTPKPLVSIERLLISERLAALGTDIYPYVECHKHGDWGCVAADMKRSNELETKKPAHAAENASIAAINCPMGPKSAS